jgi:hypothetical protein
MKFLGSFTWTVNSSAVTSENMDGEVVAIHLASGLYYSLRGSAAFVWSALEIGTTVEELAALFVVHYGLDQDQTRKDMEQFLTHLAGEDLIKQGTTAASLNDIRPVTGQPYSPPHLEKFADLQELLLLDPIHEVDPRGWPYEKPA